MVSSPETKVTKSDPERVASVVNVVVTFGASGLTRVSVKLGKALKGKGGFSGGQDAMKAEARVNIAFGPTGVPTMFDEATSPRESR